jgi:hypothetical protein
MRRIRLGLFAILLLAGCQPANHAQITQDELVRRTQAMMDAVVPGNQRPWQENLADDLIYFDEKGRPHDKTSLVNGVTPMPTGYSGTIKIVRPKSHIEGDVAILSYDMDETETIYGQNLTARYHATDTWMWRNGRWQIAAGQVLRYYEDPATGKADPKKFADYMGTYELAPGITRTVMIDGKELYSQRGERPKELLLPEAGDLFFRKGVEGRILFRRGDNGKVDALVDRRNNEDVVWTKK